MFAGTQFEAPGVYTIEVVVDEVMKLRYPIPSRHRRDRPPRASPSEQSAQGRSLRLPKENI